MSTDHLLKSGVETSNGDVTSGRLRPLVTETTSGRNLENHKILKNLQTVANRRVQLKDQKEPLWVSLSNTDTISTRWRHLLLISFSGLFF
jgi:hypothetical protein